MVVLIFVAGEDAEDTHTDHVEERVLDQLRIAWVVEGRGERRGQADTFVELPQQQEPRIRRERSMRDLNLDRPWLEEIEVKQRSRL